MTEDKNNSPFMEELVDDKTPVTDLIEPDAPAETASPAEAQPSHDAVASSRYESEVRFLVFRLDKTESALADFKSRINWLLLLFVLIIGGCGMLMFRLKNQVAAQNSALQAFVADSKNKVPAISFFHWEQGQSAVKLIKSTEGFCFLTKVTGRFEGGGEAVRLWINADGYWYLGGDSHQQGVSAECAVLKY